MIDELNIGFLLAGLVLGFLFGYFLFRLKLRKMEIQAKEDYLTRVSNYREFDRHLNFFLKQYRKKSLPFSLALIDLDGFKKINDQYGYAAGDHVIKESAELIRNNVRAGDRVFRYKHGDEFAVIFPGILSKGVLKAAERIRKNINDHTFLVPGDQIGLSVSIGVASLSEENIRKNELIAKLEKALQEAKKEGDKVCFG